MRFYAMIFMMIFLVAVTATAQYSETTALTMSIVNQDPDPGIAGDTVEVRIGIENQGGEPAEDVMVELSPTYPFSLVSGENSVRNVGTIRGFQEDEETQIIKYRLKIDSDVKAGTYDLDVTYTKDGSAAKITKTLAIDVKSSEGAEIIYIDKTTLHPGEESEIAFTINNVGNAPLNDITFTWENPDEIILPVGSDNSKFINEIPIGGQKEVEYTVIADSNADPGLYKLLLTISYDDPITGSTNTISTIAGVYVGGGTDFEVALSESSSGETSFTIANVGANPADSVSVSIPDQDGWRVTGPTSSIIGNLNQGDYTVASFSLSSASMMATTGEETAAPTRSRSSEPLIVKIAYTDTKGARQTVEKEVEISPQNMISSTAGTTTGKAPGMRGQQTQTNNAKWYAIGAIVILVGGFFWYRHKRKKGK